MQRVDRWPAPQQGQGDFFCSATLRGAKPRSGPKRIRSVQELIAQGRIRPRGQAEIDKAKADGRWDRAYQGQATAQVPEGLQRALDAEPAAKAGFESLKSQPCYHILHLLMIAKTERLRVVRIARFITQLNEESG